MSKPASGSASGDGISRGQAHDHAQQVIVGGHNTGTVTVTAHHHPAAAPPREPITSSLPADPRTFVGRDREVRQILDAAAGQRVVSIHAIDGMAGIGKTTLAIRAAHTLAPQFPDGQYLVELHAHTPGQQRADPSDVLAELLIELGVDPRGIPGTLTGRRDLWRDRLAAKRVLLVLDDAASREQIEPLLPSGSGCLTLVTSRHRLDLVRDLKPLPLRVLDETSAAELFLAIAQRDAVDAEHEVARRIAGVCGYLPLAIVLVAGRLARHTDWATTEIADLAAEFEAAADRLAELDTLGDPVVRAAFDLSYRDLPAARQLLFRRLGLHPGPDLDAHAVAALVGMDLTTARQELTALSDDHLIDETARGRYRLHDLVRDYARTLTTTDPADDNARAVRRLLDYYQHAATRANRWLARLTRDVVPATGADVAVRGFDDEMSALSWVRVERTNLLACLEYTANHDHVRMVALTGALAGLLDWEGAWSRARFLHQRAAEAAERLGDRLGQAQALTNLGLVQWRAGGRAKAVDLLRQAVALHQQVGNRLGEASALNSLGYVHRMHGDYDQALDLYRRALTLFQEAGDRHGEAQALNGLGNAHQLTGAYGQAADLHRQALTRYREIGHRHGEATSLAALGYVFQQTGDYRPAADLYRQVIPLLQRISGTHTTADAFNDLGCVLREIGEYEQAADLHRQALIWYREIGDRFGEAITLDCLGCVLRETGEYGQAADLLQRASTLHREIGNRPFLIETLGNLAILHERTQDHEQAIDLHRRALHTYREIGHHPGQGRELNGIGRVLLATGKPADALAVFTEALELTGRIGSRHEQARALDGIARGHAILGDTGTALTRLREAVELYRSLGTPEILAAEAYLATLAEVSTAADQNDASARGDSETL